MAKNSSTRRMSKKMKQKQEDVKVTEEQTIVEGQEIATQVDVQDFDGTGEGGELGVLAGGEGDTGSDEDDHSVIVTDGVDVNADGTTEIPGVVEEVATGGDVDGGTQVNIEQPVIDGTPAHIEEEEEELHPLVAKFLAATERASGTLNAKQMAEVHLVMNDSLFNALNLPEQRDALKVTVAIIDIIKGNVEGPFSGSKVFRYFDGFTLLSAEARIQYRDTLLFIIKRVTDSPITRNLTAESLRSRMVTAPGVADRQIGILNVALGIQ